MIKRLYIKPEMFLTGISENTALLNGSGGESGSIGDDDTVIQFQGREHSFWDTDSGDGYSPWDGWD